MFYVYINEFDMQLNIHAYYSVHVFMSTQSNKYEVQQLWLSCGLIARKDIVEFYSARKNSENHMGDDFRKRKREVSVNILAYQGPLRKALTFSCTFCFLFPGQIYFLPHTSSKHSKSE